MEDDRPFPWWPAVRSTLRVGLGLAALLTASCSAFCVVFDLYDFAAVPQEQAQKAFSLGAGVLSAGIGLVAVIVAKMTLWPGLARHSRLQEEQKILALAETSGGRVTVAEVASHCQLSIAQSRAALDRMAAQGVAELLFTGEAVPVFRFPGLPSPAEKAAATSLDLEDPGTAGAAEATSESQAEEPRAEPRRRLKIEE